MTEPVAWRIKDNNGISGWRYTRIKPTNQKRAEPLYTAEKLHPRVKMTQKQYNRFMWDKENTDLSICLEYFIHSDGNNHFGLPSENLKGNLTQEDIARAWLNPEETIEVDSNMKWFVRRILPNAGGNMLYYTDEGVLTYNNNKEHATKFDTKEEAERWVNPLTEAVQLPVEGE